MSDPTGPAPDEGAEQGGIAEAIRRYIDAVAGATESLAKRGEARAKQIQEATRDLAERSARDQRELMGLINKEIRRQIDALGLARRNEVDELRERLDSLEHEHEDPKS